ncbi:Anthocyanin 5-aromatic acyltransferase [Morella rubra]|nr:Anthocyanin 5-aromatic acyltransferase [Morella rubra]
MEMKKVVCAVLFAAASMSTVLAHEGHEYSSPAPAPGPSSGASASLPVVGSMIESSITTYYNDLKLSRAEFFYEYPYPIDHFTSNALPNLKNSLSLALQNYYPLAGNLQSLPEPGKPALVYSEGDNVLLILAESEGDFNHLSDHSISKLWHLYRIAYQHVVADGRTFNNFLKTWASFCCLRDHSSSVQLSLPSFDRKVIVDTHGLEEIFLKEWWKRKSSKQTVTVTDQVNGYLSNIVRATFVVGSDDMERIKTMIIANCNKENVSIPIHLSAYVLTCAFVWVCLLKIQESPNGKCCGEDPNYFGFIAGGITRLDFPVPLTYFGNCVGFGRATATRNELVGEDGVVVAAKAIGSTVKRLDKAIFGGAEKWISDWEVLFGSELHVMVSGSPKLDLYETDFGWGRAKKIEDISIDRMRAISLTESRDAEGGIEVGLTLPKAKMDAFSKFFDEGLKALP